MRRIVLLLLLTTTVYAQESNHAVETCGSAAIHKQLMATDSVYAKKMNRFEEQMNRLVHRSTSDVPVLIVPVVVHIMHKGEAIGTGTNISDQAVFDRLKAINNNFRRTIGTDANSNGADVGIEFALAVRDPNGLCTAGIERIDMTSYPAYMSYGVKFTSTNGMSRNDLKNISSWNTSQYYNMYMVSEIDNNSGGNNGTQGIADFASTHGQPGDGIVVIANTSPSLKIGNTETHELGHALNLYHTFEGDGSVGAICPSPTGCGPGVGDCCNDTQPHKRSTFSCNITGTNECDNNSANALIATNYMNYTSCMDMFTEDQKNRMRNTLTTIRGSFLLENGNMSLMPSSSPTANYRVSSQTTCAGEYLQFYDRSSCIPNSYSGTSISASINFNWIFTNGTTTITSAAQNPKLRFEVPGNYNLTYTVTNSFGSNTITVANAVIVNYSSLVSCYPTSNFVGYSGYSVNKVGLNTFTNNTQQGYTGGYIDFSCTDSTTVNANQVYYLELSVCSKAFSGPNHTTVYIDYNNNAYFEASEKIFEGSYSTAGSNYNVSSAILIPNNTVLNTFLRMRAIASSTPITDDLLNCNTSFAIGDIEDYAVKVVDPLANPEFTKNQAVLYPNPVKDNLSVESPVIIDRIQIHSNLGQLLLDTACTRNTALLDVSNYPKGLYFVSVYSAGKSDYYKIIKD